MLQLLESFCSRVDKEWGSLYWTCGLKECKSRIFMRSIPQDRVGIRMGDTWFCSIHCFVKEVRNQLIIVANLRSIEMPRQPRVPIGSVLLGKGWITEDALRRASAQCIPRGELLEDILTRMGLVDERQLTAARAIQWGYPVLGKERVIGTVESDLPLELMRAHSCVPLHHSKSAKRLVLGFVYRVEHSLLHAVEQATGCRVEACFVTPSDYHYQMGRVERELRCQEHVLEDSLTPSEIARRVGGFALETRARVTSFSRCRALVWIRLSGERRSVDVLFRYKADGDARGCDSVAEPVEDFRAFG